MDDVTEPNGTVADSEVDGGTAGAFAHVSWDGDTVPIDEVVLENGHVYASYVNTERVIPAIDGFKPSQRRIIWAMSENGVAAARTFRKSAETVGSVIGRYHPHGDTAVYDALVRMAQHFQSTLPLIDGQGNFGSLDDKPAAMRYTESRLSAVAAEWIADLRPEVVPFKPNFTEKRQEPTLITVSFPALFTISQSGIGWALASTIPPHNLGELIDATILIAQRPEATSADLLRKMPGPDFPGGGVIVTPERLAECYETGRGTVQLQGRFHIEAISGNRQAITVTELPYLISPDSFIDQIVRAARDGKIEDVTETPRNLSSRDHPVRVQIVCKRGGNVQRLVADLLRYTKLRDTVTFNFTILLEGKPKLLGLRDILGHWTTFRQGIITRRLEHERATLLRDLHRLLGLLAALDAIDAVIKIVRGAEDDEDAKTKLIAKLRYRPHGARKAAPIDADQAQWIIEMQIRRLVRLNRLAIEEEAARKGTRIDEITELLESEHGVRDLMIGELRDIKRQYATPRHTALSADAAATPTSAEGATGAPASTIPAQPVVVHVATSGQGVVAAPGAGKRAGGAMLALGADDTLHAVIATTSDVPLYLVTEDGVAFRASLAEAEPETKRGRGRALAALARGQRIGAACVAGDATHALLVTAGGIIKRVEMGLLEQAGAGGVQVIGRLEDDRLIACVPHHEGDEVILASAAGQALRLEMDTIRPVQSGPAGGVAGMRLAGADEVVDATLAHGEVLVILHEEGAGKVVALHDYPTKGRGGQGVASAAIDKPAKDPAGAVRVHQAVPAGTSIAVLTARGQYIALDLSDHTPVARGVVSRRMVDLGPGDEVVGLLVT